MQDLKQLTLEELRETIGNSQKIVIVPHKNPDGDAIGSSLGFYHFLQQLGKQAAIVVNDAVPEFLNFLPEAERIYTYENDSETSRTLVATADLIFCLDYAQLHRAGILGELIADSTATKVVVDHHPEPEQVFNFYYHEVASSSTCELIYHLVQELHPGFQLSQHSATCLYTGLMTDTGCFRYALRPKTFMVAAELLKTGISYEWIVSSIFDTNTTEKLQLLGYALNQRMQVLPEYRTAFIALSFEDGEKLQLKKGDTEGLVNYALSIRNTAMAAFFYEKEKGKTKISLRSKGNFAVNAVSAAYFGGGGHKNAAGGEYNGTAEETVARFMEVLPQYKDELLSLEIGKRD
jgi:phosphoesterase RecJ-like protein